MPPTGARRLREDDYWEPRPTRHLRAVRDTPRAVDERSRFADRPASAERPRPLPLVEDGYVPAYAENGRRTVTITGHPVPPRRRAPIARSSHLQARPDRIALWAFLLGLFLVFMAVATANAATL